MGKEKMIVFKMKSTNLLFLLSLFFFNLFCCLSKGDFLACSEGNLSELSECACNTGCNYYSTAL